MEACVPAAPPAQVRTIPPSHFSQVTFTKFHDIVITKVPLNISIITNDSRLSLLSAQMEPLPSLFLLTMGQSTSGQHDIVITQSSPLAAANTCSPWWYWESRAYWVDDWTQDHFWHSSCTGPLRRATRYSQCVVFLSLCKLEPRPLTVYVVVFWRGDWETGKASWCM